MNRDLSKVIYIDYDPHSFQLNPENVLRLPKWEGDMDDTALVDLAELLKSMFVFSFRVFGGCPDRLMLRTAERSLCSSSIVEVI